MGTWGGHSFENDGAADWLASFREDGPEAAVDALEAVLRNREPDADTCAEALAAADAVAIALRHPRAGETDEVTGAVARYAAELRGMDGIADLARQAVTAATSPRGELYALWCEDGAETGDWMAATADLLGRVEAAQRAQGTLWERRYEPDETETGLVMTESEATVFRLDVIALSDRIDQLSDRMNRRFDEIAERLGRMESGAR